jgi:spore germination protein GerM
MNKQAITLIAVIIIILAVVGIFVAGRNQAIAPAPEDIQPATTTPTGTTTHPTQETQNIKLYYSNTKNPKYSGNECSFVAPVTRTINKTQTTAHAALKELFKGPTAQEKAQGFVSPLEKPLDNGSGQQVGPLGNYYLGVSITNGTAVVNFKPEAMRYLNSPACIQGLVKTTIEKTLKQFPTVKKVEYAIDGEVVTEWDA